MIIRIRKERNYTAIANEPIEDERLSAESLGVLTYLLSKPDGWQVRKKDLLRRFKKNSKNKIETVFRELRDAGYAELVRFRDENGKMIGSGYDISEYPITETHCYRDGNISDLGNLRGSEKSETRKSSRLEKIAPIVSTDFSLVNTDYLVNTDISISTKENGENFKNSEDSPNSQSNEEIPPGSAQSPLNENQFVDWNAPDAYLEAAKRAKNFLKTDGDHILRGMAGASNSTEEEIMKMVDTYFGKMCDLSNILRDWKKQFGKIQNWQTLQKRRDVQQQNNSSGNKGARNVHQGSDSKFEIGRAHV